MLRESLSLGTLQESEQSEGSSLDQPPEHVLLPALWGRCVACDTQPWEQRAGRLQWSVASQGMDWRTWSGWFLGPLGLCK